MYGDRNFGWQKTFICNWSYRYDHKSGRVLYFYSFLMRRCIYFYYILSYSVRSDGDPKTAAAASVVLIVLNIVLDILFMGIMNFGIKGASLALCIATFAVFWFC